MTATLAPLFAIGLPQSHPGDYAHVLKWPFALFFVMTVLLFAYGYRVARSRKREAELHSEPEGLAATTKACGYCGRDNGLESTHCWECGTAFLTPELDANISKQDPFAA